jgi:hypothetical protein
MADNLVVKDGLGANKTLRTEDIGSDVHVPLQIPADETGAPFTAANPVPVAPPASSAYGTGTRQYNLAAGTRTAVLAASSAEVAIGTLGASREVLINPSVRCFIAFGATGMSAAAVAAGNLPVPADAMLHLRIPAGVTHYRVIRDATSDGFVSVIPVA